MLCCSRNNGHDSAHESWDGKTTIQHLLEVGQSKMGMEEYLMIRAHESHGPESPFHGWMYRDIRSHCIGRDLFVLTAWSQLVYFSTLVVLQYRRKYWICFENQLQMVLWLPVNFRLVHLAKNVSLQNIKKINSEKIYDYI